EPCGSTQRRNVSSGRLMRAVPRVGRANSSDSELAISARIRICCRFCRPGSVESVSRTNNGIMNTRLASILFPILLVTSVSAQEAPDMSPAKELAKLEPLIGNWAGTGKMAEPGGTSTDWTAKGTYQWCLNKHFVQEDFEVRFEGNPVPMLFRNYLGWDKEGQRYVSVLATNEGIVRLNAVSFLEDGTMLQMMTHQQEGVPYIERARTKVTGDSMSLVIDVLMSE